MKRHLKTLAALFLGLSLTACGQRLEPGQSKASYQAVILSPTQDAMLVFDLLTNRVRYRIPSGATPGDMVLGDGGLIFIAHSQEPSFMVFQRADPFNWFRIGKVGTLGTPTRLLYNPHAQELYVTTSGSNLLSVYRVQGLRRPLLQQTVRLDNKLGVPQALALSADGQKIFVAGQVLQSLSRSNERLTAGETQELPENSQVSDMLLTGEQLFLSDKNLDQLHVLNSNDLKLKQSIELKAEDLQSAILPTRMALNHAGSKLYLTGAGASVVQVIDVANAKLLQTLQLDAEEQPFTAGSPYGLAISNDDQRVYITAQSGRNLVILESSPELGQTDQILRSVGTNASAALLPPLGTIQIF